MQDVFSTVHRIAPDISAMLQTRYDILCQLKESPMPLGRKSLAERVALSERSLRTIIETMKAQSLVEVSRNGIQLTTLGENMLSMFSNALNSENRRYDKEEQLKAKLGITQCWVVPGDLEQDKDVYHILSYAVEQVLQQHLNFGRSIIAVTGGETLAHVGEGLTESLTRERDLVFVPARGGVGGGFNIQANIVGGVMAQQTNAKYVPLFLPDAMEEVTSKVLLNDPSISQAVTLGKQADCLLVSVGSAQVMAERRELTAQQQNKLHEQQAIGEVFGVFFDEMGQEVLRLPRIGIQLEDISQIPLVLTIVAGASKAQAVEGYCKLVQSHGWLICDEGVANMILNGATY